VLVEQAERRQDVVDWESETVRVSLFFLMHLRFQCMYLWSASRPSRASRPWQPAPTRDVSEDYLHQLMIHMAAFRFGFKFKSGGWWFDVSR
jgi:hypothetical protein